MFYSVHFCIKLTHLRVFSANDQLTKYINFFHGKLLFISNFIDEQKYMYDIQNRFRVYIVYNNSECVK